MAKDRKPGKWMYWLAAGIFFVGGVLSFLLWTAGTRNHLLHNRSQMEGLARVPVSPEGRVINLPAGGNAVFVEHRAGDGAFDEVGVRIIAVETSERVPQFQPLEPWSYRRDAVVGDVYSEFGIEKAGEYLVTAQSLEGEATTTPEVAVGPWSTNRSAILMIAVGMTSLAISLLSGFVLAFVTFFMRRKS